MYQYTGIVYNVVDGDTIDVLVDLGFKISTKQRFRLNGLDTPERGQPGFNEAKTWLESQILNQQVNIKTSKVSKFGYYLADVTKGTISINEGILNQKLAKPYDGGSKLK